MDELISKQAAIDDIRTMNPKDAQLDIKWVEMWLKQLPPAQPEPCEDAVSREEVLNCLEWQYPDKLPRTKIMELPPVTPKQRTGKWIDGHCSECGTHAPYWAMASTYHRSNFCPNCGAKMTEGDAE